MKEIVSLSLDDVREYAPAAFSAVAHPRVSDRYSLFKTSDLIESFLKAGWQVTRANQSAVHTDTQRSFSRHLIALSNPDLRYEDEQIEILLVNSNDGRSKYHTELGVYRFACANGLVDAAERFAEMDLRHFGYAAEHVLEASSILISHVPKVVEVIDSWKAKRLSWPTQLEFAYFALTQRWPEKAPIQAGDLLERRRTEDVSNSLWTTLNVIQENLLKGGQTYEKQTLRGLRSLHVRSIRSISGNLSLNKRLWNAAEALYEGRGLALPA